MALSYLLKPRSTLCFCRSSKFSTSLSEHAHFLSWFPTARRCCSSLCSDGGSDNPPQLEKEVVAEETRTMDVRPVVKETLETKPGPFSKEPFTRNKVAAYGGSKNVKTLTDLFRNGESRDEQLAGLAETEETNFEEGISDVLLNIQNYENTQFEQLNRSYGPLPRGDLQDGCLKKLDSIKCKEVLPEDQNARYGGAEMPAVSNNVQKILDLEDCNPKAYQPFEPSNDPPKKDAEKLSDIEGLIDVIRLQEDVLSNTANSYSKTGLIPENSLNANLQTPDNKDKLTSLNCSDGDSRIQNEEISISDFQSTESRELKANMGLPVPTGNKDQKQLEKNCLAEEEPEENKVFIRFLRNSVTEEYIFQQLSSCGEISKVEFPYARGPLFKSAYVYFKSQEGHKNALKISGLVVGGAFATVESVSSVDDRTVKFAVPSLLGDPDIPSALVKNPTRTIKIEQLTCEISSHHIEKALAFCGSKISGYVMGSSSSVAYVEFETEIGKERALMKQSINVLGRHLEMLRIDCPRTTVVRISNIQSLGPKKIMPICKSLGKFRASFYRSADILDVHFDLAEWPNMLKILNRLNGLNVDGRRLRAEAAPVFPPDVLLALWNDSEERKRLKATAQALLRKVGENNSLDTSELASLGNAFVDEI